MRDMRVEWSGYDVHPKWGLALHVLLFVDQIDRYLRRVPACMRACANMDEPQEHTFIHLALVAERAIVVEAEGSD